MDIDETPVPMDDTAMTGHTEEDAMMDDENETMDDTAMEEDEQSIEHDDMEAEPTPPIPLISPYVVADPFTPFTSTIEPQAAVPEAVDEVVEEYSEEHIEEAADFDIEGDVDYEEEESEVQQEETEAGQTVIETESATVTEGDEPEPTPLEPSIPRPESAEQSNPDAEFAEPNHVEHTEDPDEVEPDFGEFYEDMETYPTDAASLPPIIVHLPKLGARSLFSPLADDAMLPVWLDTRLEELGEATLSDVWLEIRNEMVKEDLIQKGEMVLVEKQMDLKMGEDDVNLQYITLLDLAQVHHGCGLPGAIQLYITFEPHRFITRFNAIQQEVQAQMSREEEEEEAEAEEETVQHEDLRERPVDDDEIVQHEDLRERRVEDDETVHHEDLRKRRVEDAEHGSRKRAALESEHPHADWASARVVHPIQMHGSRIFVASSETPLKDKRKEESIDKDTIDSTDMTETTEAQSVHEITSVVDTPEETVVTPADTVTYSAEPIVDAEGDDTDDEVDPEDSKVLEVTDVRVLPDEVDETVTLDEPIAAAGGDDTDDEVDTEDLTGSELTGAHDLPKESVPVPDDAAVESDDLPEFVEETAVEITETGALPDEDTEGLPADNEVATADADLVDEKEIALANEELAQENLNNAKVNEEIALANLENNAQLAEDEYDDAVKAREALSDVPAEEPLDTEPESAVSVDDISLAVVDNTRPTMTDPADLYADPELISKRYRDEDDEDDDDPASTRAKDI